MADNFCCVCRKRLKLTCLLTQMLSCIFLCVQCLYKKLGERVFCFRFLKKNANPTKWNNSRRFSRINVIYSSLEPHDEDGRKYVRELSRKFIFPSPEFDMFSHGGTWWRHLISHSVPRTSKSDGCATFHVTFKERPMLRTAPSNCVESKIEHTRRENSTAKCLLRFN